MLGKVFLFLLKTALFIIGIIFAMIVLIYLGAKVDHALDRLQEHHARMETCHRSDPLTVAIGDHVLSIPAAPRRVVFYGEGEAISTVPTRPILSRRREDPRKPYIFCLDSPQSVPLRIKAFGAGTPFGTRGLAEPEALWGVDLIWIGAPGHEFWVRPGAEVDRPSPFPVEQYFNGRYPYGRDDLHEPHPTLGGRKTDFFPANPVPVEELLVDAWCSKPWLSSYSCDVAVRDIANGLNYAVDDAHFDWEDGQAVPDPGGLLDVALELRRMAEKLEVRDLGSD